MLTSIKGGVSVKNRNGIVHLIAVVVLLLLGIIVLLGEKYSNEPKCAEPGCDKPVCYNSDYCYTHHKEHTASDSQTETATATNKKKTALSARDPDIYNAKGYDNFDAFYNDHYKDFFDYGDAKDYYYSNRY